MEEKISTATQYLTFTLDQELFALNIDKVREVLDCSTVTKVPQMPDYICGVINLRGSVVPVVDLRRKFNMGLAEKTVNTCIIIVEVSLGETKVVMGAMADAVQEVLDLDADHIEAPPRIGTKLNTEFIAGMGKHGNEFIIILEIDRIFSEDESLTQEIIDVAV